MLSRISAAGAAEACLGGILSVMLGRCWGSVRMADIAVRRADFMMVLAYATDLATGQSRDFALRSCVLAMRLATALHLDTAERRKVYHQAILRYIGCNADTHLLASAFGDEIALRQDLAVTDLGSHSELGAVFVRAFTRVFADLPPDQLKQAVQQGLAEAIQVSVPILAGHCEVAQRIGARIGLDRRDPREPRPALRALGRARAAAGAEGLRTSGCRFGWSPWPRTSSR